MPSARTRCSRSSWGSSLKDRTADVPQGRAKVQRVLADDTIQRFETVQRRDDGQEILLEISASRIMLRGRQAILTINRDITEARRSQKVLRRAQRLEALGQFAASIAHDFRNIAAVIQGATDLLHSRVGGDPKLKQPISTLRQAVGSARDLTHRLVSFSRRAELKLEDLDLERVVDRAMPLLRALLPERISIHRVASGGPLPVAVDQKSLEQVLLNLCANARDAMPDGGEIVIETGRRPPPTPLSRATDVDNGPELAYFEVGDTGGGMDAETQKRVLDPFFTTKEKGTGLGLASAYGTAKQHGGHLAIDSEPGSGTRCAVLLPLRPEAETRAESTSPEKESSVRKLRVLLIEDDQAFGRVVVDWLALAGHDVEWVTTGEDALARLDGGLEVFDAVITDHGLPGMTGPEVYHRVSDESGGIPFLFCCGTESPPVQPVPGRVAWLQKPFELGALERSLDELLETGGRGALQP